MRLRWEGMSGLALEQRDRPGLASFLEQHRACEGGIDVRPMSGEDGLMIRVTCTRCGSAIEAEASSWEGWWEERAMDVPTPLRRFESRRTPRVASQPAAAQTRVEREPESRHAPGWQRVLAMIVVGAWMALGVALIASAILR